MSTLTHHELATVSRDGVFARWERRLLLINILRRALPAIMVTIALVLIGLVTNNALRAPRPVKGDDPIIRMVGARFQGRVEDGRSFLIGAQEAARDEREPNRVTLVEPIMVVGAETETPRRVMARTGVYDENTKLLRLSGDVRIDDGLGNRVATNDTVIDTRTGEAVGQQGIEGDGPAGQVSAGSYTIKDKGDRIEFRGRVRTRVNPE
ncbi:MAG: LPS export ABC transporter periplasmic protein LptC [Caulobacter sp.]|nr:LPS export ABC transporter periplasmic protein LptC [Caulobacter sp.]